MSKKINSKIAEWKGSITLTDPLLLPQVLALRKAARAFRELGDDPIFEEMVYVQLPALLGCVEEWNIKGKDQPTVDTFPYTGTKADQNNSAEFFLWLHKEINVLFGAVEEDDPNL